VVSTHAVGTGIHHLVITRDVSAKTYTFYDNGVEYDTIAYTTNPTHGETSKLSIATTKSLGDNNIDGKMDNVAVYNYALSASRVLVHYNAGI